MARSLAVNCSILMKELPVADRLTLARDAGFTSVEFWWPFETASPSEADVDRFVGTILDSGLQLVGLNLFAGDMAAGDRGVLSWPSREAELEASVAVAAGIGARLGTKRFNALYGNRLDGIESAVQDRLAERNLRAAADRLADVGGVAMIEPVSGLPRYPITTAAAAVAVIDRAGDTSDGFGLGLLLDVYHLAVNGDDVETAILAFQDRIVHVQVADAPGRGVPGTGDLPLTEWMGALRSRGYDGIIALECVGDPLDPFAQFDFEAWRNFA